MSRLRIACLILALSVLTPLYGAETSTAAAAAQTEDKRTNIEKLSDKDSKVRRNAVIYIGAERKKENIKALLPMLSDASTEVQRAAINALVNSGDKEAVVQPLLDKYKTEKNVSVRMNLIVSLGETGSKAAIPAVKETLKDPFAPMRNEAVRALGKINDRSTYQDIVAMLKDESEGVRIISADTAAKLKLTAANPQLIKNLNDPVALVRKASVSALGQIGSKSSLPEIEKMTLDKDSTVAAAAKVALDAIQKPAKKK
jgi:HEAT repeat protein